MAICEVEALSDFIGSTGTARRGMPDLGATSFGTLPSPTWGRQSMDRRELCRCSSARPSGIKVSVGRRLAPYSSSACVASDDMVVYSAQLLRALGEDGLLLTGTSLAGRAQSRVACLGASRDVAPAACGGVPMRLHPRAALCQASSGLDQPPSVEAQTLASSTMASLWGLLRFPRDVWSAFHLLDNRRCDGARGRGGLRRSQHLLAGEAEGQVVAARCGTPRVLASSALVALVLTQIGGVGLLPVGGPQQRERSAPLPPRFRISPPRAARSIACGAGGALLNVNRTTLASTSTGAWASSAATSARAPSSPHIPRIALRGRPRSCTAGSRGTASTPERRNGSSM